MKILVFGDVVGKPGRETLTRALPELREEYSPDSIVINVENMAHGLGISPATMDEALAWEADVYTTGDHAWDNKSGVPLLNNKEIPVVRPANYPEGVPGRGYHVYSVGAYRVAVINLQGQVFFKNQPLNPFHVMDEVLNVPEVRDADVRLVDFQAEATSEKRAMGWYLDGRVSAVLGTHTHVPTNDAQILPEGTGYISDLGMNGLHNSILGIDKEGPLKGFLMQIKQKRSFDAGGALEVGAVLLEIDPKSGKTTAIAPIRKILKDE